MMWKKLFQRSNLPINPNPDPVPFHESELSDEAKSIRAIIDKMASSDDPAVLKRAEELLSIDFLDRREKDWLTAYIAVKMAEAQKDIARELFAKMLVDDAPLPFGAGRAINELRKRDLQHPAVTVGYAAQQGTGLSLQNQALMQQYQNAAAQQGTGLSLQNSMQNSVMGTAVLGHGPWSTTTAIVGNGITK